MHVLLKTVATLLAFFVAASPAAVLAQNEQPKRLLDFFDKVEITFTAEAITAVGKDANTRQAPTQSASGKLILFVPKVRDDAEGFWETSAVRFASMSVKAGDYSFPMTRTSASLQFIDNRPMRLVIGRAPAGRDNVMPGTQDFSLALVRDKRSRNDYQLAFSQFAFTLFGEKGIQFVSKKGSATVKVLEEQQGKGKSDVDLGFSFGPSDNRQ